MEVPTLKKGEAHRGPGVSREREVPIPQDRNPKQSKIRLMYRRQSRK